MKTNPPRINTIEKKKRRSITIIIGIFFILIMLTSVLELWSGQEENVYSYIGKYGEYKFVQTDNGWQAYINNAESEAKLSTLLNNPIILQTNPKDLQSLKISISFAAQHSPPYYSNINEALLNFLSAQKLYLSYNPEEQPQFALYNLERNFKLSTQVVDACYKDVPSCGNMVIKTCKDANQSAPVILLNQSQDITQDTVYFDNSCLVLEGKDLLITTDKLLFELL